MRGYEEWKEFEKYNALPLKNLNNNKAKILFYGKSKNFNTTCQFLYKTKKGRAIYSIVISIW